MLYIPSLRLCFLHIPKTAGTWVRVALRSYTFYCSEYGRDFEHADLASVAPMLPDDVEYFSAVRHPFAWLRSYWVDRQLKGWGGDLQIGLHCQVDDFEQFVRTVCNMKRGYITELFERYVGPCQKPRARIVKTENVSHDLRRLLEGQTRKCGSNNFSRPGVQEIQPLNLGAAYPAFHAKTEGHPELWELVRVSEPKIYDAFGYEVEPPPRVTP